MASSTEFKVRITAQMGELRAALDQLNARLARVGTSGRAAGAQASQGLRGIRGASASAAADARRMESSLASVGRSVRGLVSAYAALNAARSFVQIADQATALRGRLLLVTDSVEDLAAAESGLFAIAQRTRSGIAATVDVYTKFAQGTEELGVSQGELLRVTETVNKAIALTGGASESANAAIIQLGQGLAAGALRGEELNSVMEQAPGLARAIAKGMGVTVGQLRKLGAEGKITAAAVLDALASQSDAIDREFAKLPQTVGGAITRVQNSIGKLIDQLNQAEGATDGLAGAFTKLSEAIDTGDVARVITAAFGVAREGAIQAIGFVERLIAAYRLLKDVAAAAFTSDTVADAYARHDQELSRIEENVRLAVADLRAERQRAFEALYGAQTSADAPRPGARTGATGKSGKPFGDVVVDYGEVEKELIAQAQARADQQYADGITSAREYYEARAQLQLDALNLEIARAREAAENAKTGEQKGAALTQVEVLESQRAGIKAEADRKIAADEKKLQAELQSIRAQSLAFEGETLQARAIEIEAQYADLVQRLKAENDRDGLALVERLIGYEKGKAALDALGDDVDEAIARFREAEQSASNSVNTGTSQSAAFDTVRQAAAETLPELRRYREELAALAPTSKDAAEKLREVDSAIRDIQQKSQGGAARAIANLRRELAGLETSFESDVAFALRDNLKGLFDDLITGSKSATEAFENFAKSFAKSVLSIITQILATKAATALLGGFGGLFSSGGTAAAVKHSGGLVGGAGVSRRVSPLVFAGAPRLHSGGVLGLRSDEVPTILQRGEEVLARNDPRNVRNGGGGSGGDSGTRVMRVQLDRDAMDMTLRDWLERELARVGATS